MKPQKKSPVLPEAAPWTFLTNHAHVLLCLARQPDLLLREVAAQVGITERGVQKIVTDLEAAGLLTRTREGRRNTYEINGNQHLRHPIEAHCTVEGLIRFVRDGEGAKSRTTGQPSKKERR